MTPRLDKIALLHGLALLRVVEQRDVGIYVTARMGTRYAIAGREMVDHFATFDPTPQHRYTQWLVRTYLANGFRGEDLGKAKETLELWHRNRFRLPLQNRDLNAHLTLTSAWKAVAPFAGVLSGKAEDRSEREAARAESIILHEGEDGLTVAVPLTERAAVWWGRGTRWCTAASKDNAFDHYNRQAPLVVVILPDGAKLQMWCQPAELAEEDGCPDVQIMDANDQEVSKAFVSARWDVLAPFFGTVLDEWSAREFLPVSSLSDTERRRLMRSHAGWLAMYPESFLHLADEADRVAALGYPVSLLPQHLDMHAASDAELNAYFATAPGLDKFGIVGCSLHRLDEAAIISAIEKLSHYECSVVMDLPDSIWSGTFTQATIKALPDLVTRTELMDSGMRRACETRAARLLAAQQGHVSTVDLESCLAGGDEEMMGLLIQSMLPDVLHNTRTWSAPPEVLTARLDIYEGALAESLRRHSPSVLENIADDGIRPDLTTEFMKKAGVSHAIVERLDQLSRGTGPFAFDAHAVSDAELVARESPDGHGWQQFSGYDMSNLMKCLPVDRLTPSLLDLMVRRGGWSYHAYLRGQLSAILADTTDEALAAPRGDLMAVFTSYEATERQPKWKPEGLEPLRAALVQAEATRVMGANDRVIAERL